MDHLIFSFHIMSFLFILLWLYILLDLMFTDRFDIIVLILIVIQIIYLVIAVKKTYFISYFGSVMRLIGVGFVHLIISTLLFGLFTLLLMLFV